MEFIISVQHTSIYLPRYNPCKTSPGKNARPAIGNVEQTAHSIWSLREKYIERLCGLENIFLTQQDTSFRRCVLNFQAYAAPY